MSKTRACGYLVLCLLSISVELWTQSPLPHLAQLPSRIHGVSTTGAVHPQQVPCWQEAGVSKAGIDERNAAVKAANARVAAVCANAALTSRERSQQIREIRQQQRAQIDTIITPEQQQAIQACNKARQPVSVAAAPHPDVRRGPCGEVLPAPASP
jgi:hypothetical protein